MARGVPAPRGGGTALVAGPSASRDTDDCAARFKRYTPFVRRSGSVRKLGVPNVPSQSACPEGWAGQRARYLRPTVAGR